jgi:hypothetical protein
MPANPYAPFIDGRDPLDVTRTTPVRLEKLLQSCGPEKLTMAPAPGKWSLRDILSHLADTEIAFAFRLRQTMAEDRHIIQPFDQDKWAVSYAYYDARSALATFSAIRQWNLAWIAGLKTADFGKPLNHPERGDMTLQTLFETMAGHDLNHLRQVEAILA